MPKVKGGKPSLRDKRAKTSKKSKSKNLPAVIEKKKVVSETTARLVEVLGPEGAKRVRMTKKKIKGLKKLKHSDFKDDLPDIFELLDDGQSSEEVQRAFLKASLASILSLIPVMEDQAHKGKRESNAYALNSLISQGREILHDIKSLTDSGNVAIVIANTVVDPAYVGIANIYANLMHSLREQVSEHVMPGKQHLVREMFTEVSRQYGQYLNVSRDSTKTHIAESIE